MEELPLVLTPTDIAAVLNISRNTAYEVIHSAGFPLFRVGKQYRVSRERFLKWLDEQAA
ncbi:DNA-binding protein [Flavonifractor sp. An91]|nr:DNA-binding protein [Flavonifractor sp. An91]